MGNILGAILPAVKLSRQPGNESFFFIADLHSITSIADPSIRRSNTYNVLSAWIACGFDPQNNYMYRQSRIPIVCELAWILNCFTPYPMLAKAHSFKDKADNLAQVNAGLFTYPVLMAADILLYDANQVPVGKDQKQHLEIARDIARTFNNQFGEIFVVPSPQLRESGMSIPGTDGKKMSKSYRNTIDIFAPEKELSRQIRSIITDNKSMEEPKDPDSCTAYKIFSSLATPSQQQEMRARYLGGNFGYGHAKNLLLELILDRFEGERREYSKISGNTKILDSVLQQGERKASKIAQKVIARVRDVLL